MTLFLFGMQPDEATAIYTLGLVAVGALTAAVLICQSILLRKQVRSAREEFIAAHPPKIVVRRFEFYPMQDEVDPVRRVPLIQFVVANEGRSDARIVASNVTPKILPRGHMEKLEAGSFPSYEGSTQVLQKTVYKPGERQAQAIVLGGIQDVPAALAGIQDGTLEIACFGFIQYYDAMHVMQERRFYRRSKPGERFLAPHTDPDYEN